MKQACDNPMQPARSCPWAPRGHVTIPENPVPEKRMAGFVLHPYSTVLPHGFLPPRSPSVCPLGSLDNGCKSLQIEFCQDGHGSSPYPDERMHGFINVPELLGNRYAVPQPGLLQGFPGRHILEITQSASLNQISSLFNWLPSLAL